MKTTIATVGLVLCMALVIVTTGCEEAIPPSDQQTPDGPQTPNGDTLEGQVSLGGGWVALDVRTVLDSDVPEPTEDAAELEISSVYLIRSDFRSAGVQSANSAADAAFVSDDVATSLEEPRYELVIEFVQEYYSYEVTEIWLEMTDGRIIKWGEPIANDCDAFLDSVEFEFVGAIFKECTPKILRQCRDFIGSCTNKAGAAPQGAPSWTNQARGSCVDVGTRAMVWWERDRVRCRAAGTCGSVNTWQFFEWNLKTSVSTVLTHFNYVCSFWTIPAEPSPSMSALWPYIQLQPVPYCDPEDPVHKAGCGERAPIEGVTVSAEKPTGGSVVSSANVGDYDEATVDTCKIPRRAAAPYCPN